MDKGILILMTARCETSANQYSYCVDSEGFQSLALSLDITLEALKSAGFDICQVVKMGRGTAKGDTADFMFTSAQKMKL